MSETLLAAALARRNTRRPPVWLMRQAGRYHRHYQALRARHDFVALCKQPALATEVTMGPIEDFGFDAAILFSDLLFPLEALGMGLRYEPGPKLDWYLSRSADLARLRDPRQALEQFRVLREANLALYKSLRPEQWKHHGMHSERGEETVEHIVRMFAGHDLNHIAQIEQILAPKKSK